MKIAKLFGINYTRTPESELRGCISDVQNMAKYLRNIQKFDDVTVYTDEHNIIDTSANNIVRTIYNLAVQSWREHIDVIYLHFSGHGTHIVDRNYDESDGKDECFVPCDYKIVGVISDDLFKKLFKYFHIRTKVICVFDCCHSGTMGDLCYKWTTKGEKLIENYHSKCKANIITISGCKDSQTSADAFNVMGKFKFTGALTSCLLLILENQNEFVKCLDLIDKTHKKLKEKKFSQIPEICSSFEINHDTLLF